MSKTFKIVSILLAIVSVVSALAAVFAFVGKEREYMKRLLLEDKLSATLKDKKRLENEIEIGKKVKEDADVKISEMEAEVKDLLSNIDEEKEKNKSAMLTLSAKEEEVAKLKSDLEKEKKEKTTISKRLEDLDFEHTRAKSEIERLKGEKAGLEKTISDLKEKSVSLDKIVVKPSPGGTSPQTVSARQPLRGSVLVVNKEYSFIVTDLGQEDGVEKGMAFEVRDGTVLLGKAEIDKVYDTMSSAAILPGSTINSMKKGNLIIEAR